MFESNTKNNIKNIVFTFSLQENEVRLFLDTLCNYQTTNLIEHLTGALVNHNNIFIIEENKSHFLTLSVFFI
eukprot:snap_masked-scaffold_37-processed-gene-1.15-mRNA-1 protein AED:1.00 eAED:1.00 QI:0/0/0/0/1/1/4/0/71